MKKTLQIASLCLATVSAIGASISAATNNPTSEQISLGVKVFKVMGVNHAGDTAVAATLGGAALVNFIDLCSSSQKADLLRKAIFGEITGKPRRIILARLGGSVLGLAGAWGVNRYSPFLRNKMKSNDEAWLEEKGSAGQKKMAAMAKEAAAVHIARNIGVRHTSDTIASAALGGFALVNFIDLCSSSQKADLLKKAIFGEITGRPRTIILARLGGSLIALAAALGIEYYRPFIRRAVKNEDQDFSKKFLESVMGFEQKAKAIGIDPS